MTIEEINKDKMPKHIAIIMDGNRTWARNKGLDPKLGHKEGAKVLEKIVKYANKIGVKYLTVYAFSTENWNRSKEEVGALMLLLKNYLNDFAKRADTENIKIRILGDTTALDNGLQKSIENAIERTKNNTGTVFNIALNYGGRAEIVMCTKKIANLIQNKELEVNEITDELFESYLYTRWSTRC